MTEFTNASSFAPKTESERKKQNWHRLDCLTRYKLANEIDIIKLKKWFEQQEQEWQLARKKLFSERLATINKKRGKHDYLRY